MVQMWLLWWPKKSTTTTAVKPDNVVITSTAAATTAAAMPLPENGSCCCISSPSSTTSTTTTSSCLSKLVRKLNKHCRSLLGSRQSTFQCQYDPLSYSLNFDTSGCGNLLEDEDYYYQYCAFSSRYVANPRTSSSPKFVPAASH